MDYIQKRLRIDPDASVPDVGLNCENDLSIICGDNLDVMVEMGKNLGKGHYRATFDLVEFDGPYKSETTGAEWDDLTWNEFRDHYETRFKIARYLMTPWGILFAFGYPEGAAEIRDVSIRESRLFLRRWITWDKTNNAHHGRKIEAILLFMKTDPKFDLLKFGEFIKKKRLERDWSLVDVGKKIGDPWVHRGGNLYHETGSGGFPDQDLYLRLADLFEFDPKEYFHIVDPVFPGLTNLDLIRTPRTERAVDLGGNLRSKPRILYEQIFRAGIPPVQIAERPRALIAYGGSGNAAIAAASLGFQTIVIEEDRERCADIYRRAEWILNRRAIENPDQDLGPIFRKNGELADDAK